MDIIEQRVIAILAEHLNVEDSAIRADTLLDELGDSLDAVEVVMEIEEEFGISIPEGSWKADTVGDLVALVRRIIDEQGGSEGVGAKRKPPQKPPGEARRELGDE